MRTHTTHTCDTRTHKHTHTAAETRIERLLVAPLRHFSGHIVDSGDNSGDGILSPTQVETDQTKKLCWVGHEQDALRVKFVF